MAVRISHERGDFCSCLAVDFVRKTVYLRQASLCTWLESCTVTANYISTGISWDVAYLALADYCCHPPPSALYNWTKLRYSSPRAAARVSSAE